MGRVFAARLGYAVTRKSTATKSGICGASALRWKVFQTPSASRTERFFRFSGFPVSGQRTSEKPQNFLPERLEGFLPPLSLRDISPALRGRQKLVRFRKNASPCRPHEVGIGVKLNQNCPLSALRATFPRPGGQPNLQTLARFRCPSPPLSPPQSGGDVA